MTPPSPAPARLLVHAVTRGGAATGARIAAALGGELRVAASVAGAAPPGAVPFALPMRDAVAGAFHLAPAHVFVMATGAVVRLVAPLLRSKGDDPAVVCVDEAGRFAVALVGGHRAGANALAQEVAAAIGAEPVVTTASEVRGTLAVDLLGRELGWTFADPRGNATRAAAAVVNGRPVLLVDDAAAGLPWPTHRAWPANVACSATLPEQPELDRFEAILLVTDRRVAGLDLPPPPGDAVAAALAARAVLYRPRTLAVGVGCDRGAPAELVARGAEALLARAGLSSASVGAVATIDLKADEPAIVELARRLGAPLRLYPAAVLDAAAGVERPSEAVRRHVGARGVAEPAALLAAGATRLLAAKERYTERGAGRSMTLAVARCAPPGQEPRRRAAPDEVEFAPAAGPRGALSRRVPPPAPPVDDAGAAAPSRAPPASATTTPAAGGAVPARGVRRAPGAAGPEAPGGSDAGVIPCDRDVEVGREDLQGVADLPRLEQRVPQDRAPCHGPGAPSTSPATDAAATAPAPAARGKLSIVGIGPGPLAQMTLAARAAVEEATVVVGYAPYLHHLGPLLAGKRLVAGRMTGEIERAREAVERARAGAAVALVSSGDAGIYGMASLALEVLREVGWRRGEPPEVAVVPGVTALSAAGALAGAPLGHDFCAVSLSDLLTPWPVIARRLEAAASADFVVALYNPASARRRRAIAEARDILLRHRPPSTPVAVVADAYRESQRAAVTDLEHLLDEPIGMTSTVLVGSSRTFAFEGLLVTPRGYADKYGWDGAAHPGERPGRPLARGGGGEER